jgi:hypothetical protein
MESLLRDLLTSFALRLVYESRRENWGTAPDQKGTGSIIRPPSSLQGFGWAWLVWMPGATWLVVNAWPELRADTGARWLATVVTCFAAPFGASLILRAKRSFVFFNRRGVIFRPALGRLRHVSWDQLQKIEYRSIRNHLVLRTKGSALPIWVGFAGFSALLDQARRSLPEGLRAELLACVEKEYLNRSS